MCLMDSPSMPEPATKQTVDPGQPAKQAESAAPDVGEGRRKANAMVGGGSSTLLTGPTGVETSALNLGKTTLLGA